MVDSLRGLFTIDSFNIYNMHLYFIVFKNKNNLNLNWDTFYDKFLLKKIKINYFKTSNKNTAPILNSVPKI